MDGGIAALLLSANGRVKPDVVVVNGQQERRTTEALITWNGAKAQKQVRLSGGQEIQPMQAPVVSAKRPNSTREQWRHRSAGWRNGQRSLAAAGHRLP